MKCTETSRFVNNTLSVRTLVPLEASTISAWNVLVWMMRASTQKWPDRQAFTYALGQAYAMRMRCGITGYGSNAGIEVVFEWIRPQLIDDPGYPGEVLTVMDQVLYHPNLTEAGFEEARYLIRSRLLRQQEDPDTVALLQGLAAIGEGTPLAVPVTGTPESLDKVTLEDVKALWAVYEKAPKSLYAVGDLSGQIQAFLDGIVQTVPKLTPHEMVKPVSPVTVMCTRDISQTSLIQGYATQTDLKDRLSLPLLVMNSILGSGQKSLLFEHIRERHSWCYSIQSSLIRHDGLLLISAGTRRACLEDLQEEIARQILRLQEDDYPQEYFDAAILELTDAVISRKDFPGSVIESSFAQDLLGTCRSEDQQLARLRAVTRQEVARAAGRLQLVLTSIVQEEKDHGDH